MKYYAVLESNGNPSDWLVTVGDDDFLPALSTIQGLDRHVDKWLYESREEAERVASKVRGMSKYVQIVEIEI